MAMKKLSQFLKFDWKEFSNGKTLQVIGIQEWVDYNTKAHMGKKIEALITKDNTPYKQNEGEHVTNAFEKITFKVSKDVNIPVGSYIEPVNVTATVYGEYRNQLSVTADDIRVITPDK